MEHDRIVPQFDTGHMARAAKTPLICIYERPADYPDKYVARLWDLQRPTGLIAIADTLEEARAAVPPGMVPLARDERDDPCIVETWI